MINAIDMIKEVFQEGETFAAKKILSEALFTAMHGDVGDVSSIFVALNVLEYSDKIKEDLELTLSRVLYHVLAIFVIFGLDPSKSLLKVHESYLEADKSPSSNAHLN